VCAEAVEREGGWVVERLSERKKKKRL